RAQHERRLVRGSCRTATAEPADDLEIIGATVHVVGTHELGRRGGDRRPHVYTLQVHPGKPVRCDANDGVAAVTQRQLSPNDRGITAERGPPEAETQDDDRRPAGTVLVPGEEAAQGGTDAEQRE